MLIDFFKGIAGVILTLAALIFISIIGVAVMFIGYFLLWGIVGLIAICFILFLIWAWITSS